MNTFLRNVAIVVAVATISTSTAIAQTYAPGATLDPSCGPSPTCIVSIVNLGQLIGQGSSVTPAAVGSVYFGADDGLGNATFGEDSAFTWDSTTNTLSVGNVSQNAQLNVIGSQLNSLFHDAAINENIFPGVSTEFTVDASTVPITNSTYVASENTLTLTGTQNLSGATTFPLQSAVVGTVVNNNTGNLGSIFGGTFTVDNQGGALVNTTGLVSNITQYSASNIDEADGFIGRVAIMGTGNITEVAGITISFPRIGTGTFGYGAAFDINSDGLGFPQPGLETVGQAVGYQLAKGILGSPALKSTAGKVYGLKIDDGALLGPNPATDEYGIYVEDKEALNYFANNVGIGRSTPGYQLDVLDSDPANTGPVALFANGSSQCIVDVAVAGLTCSSDKRLKKNIERLSISDEAVKIQGLEPVKYNWLAQDDGTQKIYGFIAQDVQQIFPEFVKENPDGKLSLSYASFVVPIVASIQDIYSKLDALALQTGTQVQDIGSLVAGAIGKLPELFIKRVRTDELCVGQTCLNEQQLQAVMQGLPVQVTTPTPVATDPVVTDTPDAAGPVVEEGVSVDTAPTEPILETPVEPTTPVVEPTQ